MPSVQNISGPFRLFFYSFDCNEPIHVHVRREKMTCKFWLEPIALSENHGFSSRELNQIRRIIQVNTEKTLRLGMNTVVNKIEPRIKHIEVTEDTIGLSGRWSCYQRTARVVVAFVGCNRGTTEYMGTYRGRSRRALA